MNTLIDPWCPRCGEAKAVSKDVCLACELEELFGLLEEHEPDWYLRGHYNRAHLAITKAKV